MGKNNIIWANSQTYIKTRANKKRCWRGQDGKYYTKKQLKQSKDFLWLIKDGIPVGKENIMGKQNKSTKFITDEQDKLNEIYQKVLFDVYRQGEKAGIEKLYEKIYTEFQKHYDAEPEKDFEKGIIAGLEIAGQIVEDNML